MGTIVHRIPNLGIESLSYYAVVYEINIFQDSQFLQYKIPCISKEQITNSPHCFQELQLQKLQCSVSNTTMAIQKISYPPITFHQFLSLSYSLECVLIISCPSAQVSPISITEVSPKFNQCNHSHSNKHLVNLPINIVYSNSLA